MVSLRVSLASTLEGRVPNPPLVLQGAVPHLQVTFILQHLWLGLLPFQGPDISAGFAQASLFRLWGRQQEKLAVCWQLKSRLEGSAAWIIEHKHTALLWLYIALFYCQLNWLSTLSRPS